MEIDRFRQFFTISLVIFPISNLTPAHSHVTPPPNEIYEAEPRTTTEWTATRNNKACCGEFPNRFKYQPQDNSGARGCCGPDISGKFTAYSMDRLSCCAQGSAYQGQAKTSCPASVGSENKKKKRRKRRSVGANGESVVDKDGLPMRSTLSEIRARK